MRCINCKKPSIIEPADFHCPSCGDLLELRLVGRHLSRKNLFDKDGQPGVWRFREGLPSGVGIEPVSLHEGGTPLVRSSAIAEHMGLTGLYIKNEGQNPTGSFKDRGMTVAVTRAKQRGAGVLLCASTGNTSASLAAYSARARMKSVVLVPSGKVTSGKLVQANVYGARILKVRGNFDKALQLALRIVLHDQTFYLMNSINPYRIEGQKTAAYELFEQLGWDVPDYVVLPVGNAGNISALWKGFVELRYWGITDRLPKMVGVQAAEAAPITEAIQEGNDSVQPWESPRTIASAIRIGTPVSWKKALRAVRESGGMSFAVTDKEILQARDDLASKEGMFVEAASATTIAALKHLRGRVRSHSKIVCIATGNGLKDQESIKVNLDGVPEFSDESEILEALKN